MTLLQARFDPILPHALVPATVLRRAIDVVAGPGLRHILGRGRGCGYAGIVRRNQWHCAGRRRNGFGHEIIRADLRQHTCHCEGRRRAGSRWWAGCSGAAVGSLTGGLLSVGNCRHTDHEQQACRKDRPEVRWKGDSPIFAAQTGTAPDMFFGQS